MDIDKQFDAAIQRHSRIYAGIHSIEGREAFVDSLRMFMRENDNMDIQTIEEIIQEIIQASKRHMN
tara:strand:+ start:6961 stop:7158 length:198 start_codon:yes stop_codon:yes gene_type:complete